MLRAGRVSMASLLVAHYMCNHPRQLPRQIIADKFALKAMSMALNLNGGTLGLSNSGYNLQGRISTLNINYYSITIDSSANEWNSQSIGALDDTQATGVKGKQDEHIYADSSIAITATNISKTPILLSAGQNAGSGIYEYKI